MAGKRRWDDPWQRFPASKPIRVEGGLATSRARGPIAESWWSRRFVETLESYGLGGRLQRGRRYARQGQVLSLATSGGLLAAQVQGSRPTPYLVSITWSPPSERQWRVVDAALRTRVGLAAYLLAGELPAELADVFAQARTPLFPVRWKELTAKCNCPDAENPCKHIAAVLYLFADRLDDDPWLLLEWRGRSRSDILTALGLDDTEVAGGADLPPWWPLRPGEPPSATNARYGVGSEGAADPPDPPDAVLRRLDELDVVAWSAPVSKVLQELYAAALRAR